MPCFVTALWPLFVVAIRHTSAKFRILAKQQLCRFSFVEESGRADFGASFR